MTSTRRALFLGGLFLTTLTVLAVEILSTRLLSVVSWYHLSFFAISLARFGMSSGAVHVYLAGERLRGRAAELGLGRYTALLAASIAGLHIVNLRVPMLLEMTPLGVTSAVVAVGALALPFYLAGIVIALALTRIPGPVGLYYAVDLLGASVGCLLVPLLLGPLNLTALVFAMATLCAIASLLFHLFADAPAPARRNSVLLAGGLAVLTLGQAVVGDQFLVPVANGVLRSGSDYAMQAWTGHSYLTAAHPHQDPAMYWDRGQAAADQPLEQMWLEIDGVAGTSMTRWDGDPASLAWVEHDVTSLAYHLRPGGRVGVIGLGGGRDALTALRFGAQEVVAVELNEPFVDMHEDTFRSFSGLADGGVEIVADEGRAYFTRTEHQLQVLQMSLVDTWASTGAGAFTLSENGLYSVDGWRVFLDDLAPDGLLAVSRWYEPSRPVEVARLLSLAVAALHERGVTDPTAHLALVAGSSVATLVTGREPLTAQDLTRMKAFVAREGFEIVLAPGVPAGPGELNAIASSRDASALAEASAHEYLDLSPATDDRPFFFNQLKPSAFFRSEPISRAGSAAGNLRATRSLLMLAAAALVLTLLTVFGPLLRSGRPGIERRPFAAGLSWFAGIGAGFMLVQIGTVQRFSVFLGHPAWSLVVILFSMILFAGIGSHLSERIEDSDLGRAAKVMPLIVAAVLLVLALVIKPLSAAFLIHPLPVRIAIVVAVMAPVSLPLGFFFPLGMRLVGRLSETATPWMWGVNGACGVLASVGGVMLALWAGIGWNLWMAALVYALLVLPGAVLAPSVTRPGARLPIGKTEGAL